MKVRRHIAGELNVNQSSVGHWFNGSRKISIQNAAKLEKVIKKILHQYGIEADLTVRDLFPDIFN